MIISSQIQVMSQSQIQVMSQNWLPEDLCLQIFSRLPAESLVRFRCVCKSWLRIISSAPFFLDHLAHQNTSIHTNKYLMFNHHTSYSLHVDESFIDAENAENAENTSVSLEINFCDDPYDELVVYGTCNGLVCLSNDCLDMTSRIYLWNPIIRKIKILPVPSLIFDISPDMLDFEEDELSTSIYICFGYQNDDYKVIMVGVVEDVCSVGIYSLSTNSWSVIDDFENDDDLDPFSLHDLISRDSRFVNGVAYFKTSDNPIVCFDMGSKVIREIGLPDETNESGRFALDVYGDSLAILTLGEHTNGLECLSICLLRYYNDIDNDELVPSWEEIFVIDASQQLNANPSVPVRFINNGKVLVKVGVKLLVCNLETREFAEVKGVVMAENIRDCLGESLALLREDNVDVGAMSYQRKELNKCIQTAQ